MQNSTRTGVIILLIVYLVSLTFLLEAMSETIAINYKQTTQSIGNKISFLGMEIGLGESFLGNVVISIAILPLWMNTLLIIIPSTILAVFIVLAFIPTIPSG